MAIDMEQFKVTFIEESVEGLDTMETVLLQMEPGSNDSEAIDNIFRAAHSIKGGSATFGFEDITNFTHVVETLLDEVRDGKRDMTQEAISLFLNSVDCIRDMLSASQSGNEVDQDTIDQVKAGLDRMLAGAADSAGQADDSGGTLQAQPASTNTACAGWKINFKPFPDMLRSGNDVVRMFRELSELGEMEVTVNTANLPALANMEAEESYLAWEVVLTGDASREQINEIFEWVEDDCELSINELTAADQQNNAAADAPVSAAPAEDNAKSGAAAAGASPAKKNETKKSSASTGESSSIRVGTDKVDTLINMVGELVITQSMLSQLGEDFQNGGQMDKVEKLLDGLAELERNTRELQENVMRIRMLPINFAFNRFPRMVYDLSSRLGKKIELKLSGEQTELDKTVMEKIGDPLVHLVRNSIDHGIEKPEVRVANGKSETGTVHLNAYHQGGNIMIEISDDGAGLNRARIQAKAEERGLIAPNEELSDEQVFDLLFQPGFSTAEEVSDVSGRGVGMDVVKRNISSLGGSIDVRSEQGKGSTFTIRLPLTLAILDGQLVRVGEQIYIVPLVSIIESLQVHKQQVNAIAGKAELYKLRDEYMPVIRLYQAFSVLPDSENLEDGLLVVVEGDGQRAGLMVDELLGQQQVVIKSLETNFKRVNGLSGATILGDGTVALIVDITGIIRLYHDNTGNPGRGQQQVVAA